MTRPQLCAAKDCTHSGSRQNNRLIQCYGGCDKNFHWKCVGLTAAGSSALKDNSGMFWFCDDCKNNSLFRLHRKIDYLYESVEATRILLRRVETNLESKVETCYSMIGNLAKVHTLSNATQIACTSDQQTTTVLDLSIRSSDAPSNSAANSNGKRKLSEDSDDDDDHNGAAVVDDADAASDDAVPEGPSKRIRNVQNSPDIDHFADLPTPTLTSAAPTAAASVFPDPAQISNPVVATTSFSTGNSTSSICLAEAGHDTAPSLSDFRSLDYFVRYDDDGNIIERIYLAPVDLPSTPSTISESNEHAMDTSSGPLEHQQIHQQPGDSTNLSVAANDNLSGIPAQHPFTGQSVPSTTSYGSTMNVTEASPNPATSRSGNSRTGICPVEATVTAASSYGLQSVPVFTSCQPALPGSSSIAGPAYPGQPLDHRAYLIPHPGNSVAATSRESAFGPRMQLMPNTNIIWQPPTQQLFTSLKSWPGNDFTGICSAEALGTALPSSGCSQVDPIFIDLF